MKSKSTFSQSLFYNFNIFYKFRLLPIANLYADYIEIYYHILFPWEARAGHQAVNNEHYKKAVKMLPILKQQNAEIEYEDNSERVKLEAYIYYLEYLLSHYQNDKTKTLRAALLGYETIAKYPNKAYFRTLIIENIGHFYLANAEWELAFKYLDEAEKVLSDDDIVSTKVQVYNNLGLYYRNANNSEKALFYYHKIPPLVEHTRLEVWKGLVSGNIAVEYEKIKDWSKAKKYTEIDYEYSIKLRQWDSAVLDAAALIRFKIELKEKTGYKDLLITLDTLENKCRQNKSKEAIYVAKVKYYTYINDFKTANVCYSKLYEISEIVHEEKLNSKIKSETSKYELEKEQDKVNALEEKNKISKLMVYATILLLFFLIIVTYVIYKNTQKRIKAERAKEQLVAERAKELEELNDYKNRLFTIMAHDLKAPALAFQNIVSVINSLIRKKEYGLLEDAGANAEMLSSQLLLTVNNLFQKNLIEQGLSQTQKHSANLYHLILLVQKEYTAYMKFKDMKFDLRIMEEWKGQTYECYEQLILIILRNFISNAVKFSHNGGIIEVELLPKANKMQLKVVDQGIGMDKKKLEELFEGQLDNKRNGTNGERGSGFGMMLCKQIADKYSMEITCQSKLGEGTTFYLEF